MFDPERLLGQMLGGSLGGLLGGDDDGRRRKRRGSGSMFGGLSMGTKAQLGVGALGLAIAAYEHYTQQKPQPPSGGFPPAAHGHTPSYGGVTGSATPPPPPPATSPAASSMRAAPPPPPAPVTAQPEVPDSDALVLIRAMIAAAAADGRIDADERAKVLDRATQAGLGDEDRRFLEHELAQPQTLDEIAASTRPELALDVYAASYIAIAVDTEAELAYLSRLGDKLGLDADRRAALHQQIEQA